MGLRSSKTITGFPGIVASYGNPNPSGVMSNALARYWGGGEVIFVGNRSGLEAGDGSSPRRPMSSLAGTGGALAALNGTTNRGHVVFVMPGHAESVSSADWASATGAASDVAIVGLGVGDARPALTWTIAGSSWLQDTQGVVFDGLRLNLEPTTGTVNVAAPITASAKGCAIRHCRIKTGTDANNKVTIGITVTTGADDFTFEDNVVTGAAAATMTTFLRLTNVDNTVIQRNRIVCGTTAAAVGPIQELTTACTNLVIRDNFIQNNAASSTACITAALASTTGWIANNFCRNMTDGSNAQIVVTSGDVQLFQNYGVNNSNETGILLGTPSV